MSKAYSGVSKMVRPLGQRPKGALAEKAPTIAGVLADGKTLPIELIPTGTALKVDSKLG